MSTILPHIALIGRAGSGKSTAAELLVKHFGYERLSFAAPLKTGCGTTTDRGLLQTVGQGVRDLHADFWVNLLVAELEQHDGPCVIDDCRYPNEVFKLKVEGFVVVRIAAPKGERIVRLKANGKLQDEAQLEHVSETALDQHVEDHYIINSGTPDDLLRQVTAVLNREQR